MRCKIWITSPTNFFKGDEIELSDSGDNKEVELTGEKGGKLKAKVSCGMFEHFGCIIDPEGKNDPESAIAFWFLKIPKPREIIAKRRGQIFGNGKFVPWMCHFERIA